MVASRLDRNLIELIGMQGGLIQEPVHRPVVSRRNSAAELSRGALLNIGVFQVLGDAYFLTCNANRPVRAADAWGQNWPTGSPKTPGGAVRKCSTSPLVAEAQNREQIRTRWP